MWIVKPLMATMLFWNWMGSLTLTTTLQQQSDVISFGFEVIEIGKLDDGSTLGKFASCPKLWGNLKAFFRCR